MAEIELEIDARDAFLPYLQRDKRWASLVVHRRGGKTFAGIQDIGIRANTHNRPGPPLRYGYIAPTRDQAKDVAWAYIKDFLGPLPNTQVNESELRATLWNGATIRLYSGDNFERMRGLYFDGVIVDEPADIDPVAWTSVIRPCLTDYNGWATFIGTPKGRNGFWRIHQHAQQSDDWFAMTLKASESGIIPDKELAEIRSTTPEHIYLQEYECDFSVAVRGAIYAKFLDEARTEGRISEGVEWYNGFPVYSAFDIGAPYNQKCWLFQVIGDGINLLECASGGDERRSPADWVTWLKAKKYSYGAHFLPHDGEILWRQQMADAELDNVLVVPKQMSVWDGINDAVQAFNRCRFHSKLCADGLEALEAYHSKEENDGITIKDVPVHDWASHYSDAFSIIHQAIRHGLCVDRSAAPRRAVRAHMRNATAIPAKLTYGTSPQPDIRRPARLRY